MISTTMLRWISRLLLVTALLLGQQAALTHALAHATHDLASNQSPDKPLPSPDHCDKCASFSHLQAVLQGQPAALPAVFTQSDIAGVTRQKFTQTVLVAYFARGPPHLI